MPQQATATLNSTWNSIAASFTSFMAFLPTLVGGLLILIVGWYIAKFVGRIVERLLLRLRIEHAVVRSRLGEVLSQHAPELTFCGLVGKLAKWFVFLIFIQASANVLGMPQVTAIINSILIFLPNLAVALGILVVGAILSGFVASLVESSVDRTTIGNPRVFSMIARYAIIGFATIAAVNQLGIATNLINILFTGLVGSLALALGLAFGLGGQGVASEITRDWYNRTSSSARLRAVRDEEGNITSGSGKT